MYRVRDEETLSVSEGAQRSSKPPRAQNRVCVRQRLQQGKQCTASFGDHELTPVWADITASRQEVLGGSETKLTVNSTEARDGTFCQPRVFVPYFVT
jgi:hypothetical protein